MAPNDLSTRRGTCAAEAHGRTIPSASRHRESLADDLVHDDVARFLFGERPVMHTEQRAERVEWGIVSSTLPHNAAAMSSVAALGDAGRIETPRHQGVCAVLRGGSAPPRADEHGFGVNPR